MLINQEWTKRRTFRTIFACSDSNCVKPLSSCSSRERKLSRGDNEEAMSQLYRHFNNGFRSFIYAAFYLSFILSSYGSLISDGPSKEWRAATKARWERQEHTPVSRSRRGKLNIVHSSTMIANRNRYNSGIVYPRQLGEIPRNPRIVSY